MRSVGFTGPSTGMTRMQVDAVAHLVAGVSSGVVYAHHGDCVGSDRTFHRIARYYRAEVHVHPSTIAAMRAGCVGDVMHPPRPALERNTTIVDGRDFVIATPKQALEVSRSGTWSTVRRARALARPIVVVLPSGMFAHDGAVWPDWLRAIIADPTQGYPHTGH